ncbi:MAG: amidohydrolase family protein [Eggerthellaceae bacterium]|nr:amidohydrolase family protein [Eggerthellaceae bacterium]
MFGECHAHVAMNGVNYAQAMALHVNGPDEAHIHAFFESYRTRGIEFIRDGGDKYDVSRRAAQIAPEYGIDYRTPIFAIHKKGHYGSIVGRAFETMRDYAQLVEDADREGADFIKIMTTGLMDFNEFGRITHEDLDAAEVREMVHIAHERGFAVMSHTNGKRAVLDAIEAGVDSIEHGNYIDDEYIAALAESRTCYVPTATVARNLIGSGRFDDAILTRIWEASRHAIARAVDAGCLIALGSDAGAVLVPHGQGTLDEYACFADAIPDRTLRDRKLEEGETFIRSTFRRNNHR